MICLGIEDLYVITYLKKYLVFLTIESFNLDNLK